MVKFYNWVGLSLLLILSCGNPINITGPKYSDVIVTKLTFYDQLIIKGSRFKNIKAVALRDPNTNQIIKRFKVTHYDDNEIFGEQLDYNKIPIPNLLDLLIDSAQGQSVIPVQFSINANSVYTGAIQNGAITPTKLKGVTSDPAPAGGNVALNYDPVTGIFFFAPPVGSVAGGGVNQIVFGEGILGEPGSSTGTQVDISVNVGETGSSTSTYIPYFSDLNELTIDSTTNANTRLLFFKNPKKVSLNFDGNLFKIHDDSITLPSSIGDLLTVDLAGKVTAAGSLFVGAEPVCLADGTGCPSGIQPITGVPPIIVTGTQVSADMGTNPGQLVQLEAAVGSGTVGSLPAVDGIKLLNIVTKINALDGITVSNGGIGIVDIGLAPAGSTGSAQPWAPALDDISTITYPPVDGEMIIGAGGKFVGQSGATLRKSIGLEIGVDVQAWDDDLQTIADMTPTDGQYIIADPTGAWTLGNTGACGPGFVMTALGANISCSTQSFVFKNRETQWYETSANGSNYLAFTAPAALAGNTIWTLPNGDGAFGTVLTTDGLGKLTWGTGNGDVRGPAASVNREVPIFSGITGKVITNSNIIIDNLVSRSLTPVVADNLPSYNGTTGNLIQDSGIATANVVTNSGVSPVGNLPAFTGTGKAIQDSTIPSANVMTMAAPSALIGNVVTSAGGKSAQVSNIILTDIPTMAVNATGTYQPILSAANNSKSFISASYSIPLGICPNGEILKSNGTNFICGPDSDTAPPVTSVFTRTGAVIAQAGDYTANLVTNVPTGAVSANTVQGAITELDAEKLALVGGDMTGTIRSTAANALEVGPSGAAAGNTGEIHYLELAAQGAQYVGFKAPDSINSNVIWTLPAAAGASGTVLTSNPGNILSWSLPSAIGIGDVVGPASSSDNALARFNSTTGKIIKNSTVILDDTGNLTGVTSINGNTSSNFVTLIATPTGPNFIYLSNGADKIAKTTDYTMPPTKCASGQILKADASGNLQCVADTSGVISFNGRSNVVMPASNDYTASMIAITPSGSIAATSTQGALNELDAEKLALAGGTMTGTLITTTQNAIQIGAPGANTGEVRFFESLAGPNYAGFKSPAVLNANYILTLPPDIGSPTQILSTSGGGVLSWTTPGSGGAGGVGDVVGPAASTSTNLASFNGTTGKLIQDSGISSTNVMTMTGPALAAGNILVSQGVNKVAIDSTINVGPGNSVTGLGTLNGRTIANWVDGPAGAISTNLAAFNGATGKLIQDSLLPTANIPTMGLNATAPNQMILSGGVSKQLVAGSYTVPASSGAVGQILTITAPDVADWKSPVGIGDVVGPSTATNNALARFDSGTGKLIQNSVAVLDDLGNLTGLTSINGKAPADFVTMATPATIIGQVMLSAGAGKAAVAAPYTFPTTSGTANQILKLGPTGLDATWQTDTGGDVVGPNNSLDDQLAVFVGTTGKQIRNVTLTYLNIVTKPTDFTAANRVALSGGNNKQLTETSYTIPPGACPNGQVLKSDGTNYNCSAVGTGDVVGPISATDNAIARYDNITGKLIQNSTVILNDTGDFSGVVNINSIPVSNFVTMIANAGSADRLYLSNGVDKIAKTSTYTFPTANGTAGQVLTSNGLGAVNWGSPPPGDVTGPGSSTINNLSSFADTSGKTLKDSGINSLNVPTMGLDATSPNQMILSGGVSKQLVATTYTVPAGSGVVGQVLTVTAPDVAAWANAVGTGNVMGPASATSNALVRFDSTSGKLIQNSLAILDDLGALSGITSINGKTAVDFVTMPTPASSTGQVFLSAGAGKAAVVTPYTFPTTAGTSGQILKLDPTGFTATWQTVGGGDVSGPPNSLADQIAVFADTTGKLIRNVTLTYLNVVRNPTAVTGGNLASFNGTQTPGVLIQDSNVVAANVITKTSNFSGPNKIAISNGVDRLLMETPYSVPNVLGIDGQILKLSAGNLIWAPDLGDVTGPINSTDGNLAAFSGTSGKIIQNTTIRSSEVMTMVGVAPLIGNVITSAGLDRSAQVSSVPLANIPLMANPAVSSNTIVLSNGADKNLKTTDYTLPATKCPVGSILKTDASQNFICVADTSGVTSFNSRTGVVVPLAGDYTGAMVGNTGTGAISSTNTQGAINELEAEKLALTGGTMTGVLTATTLITTLQNGVQVGNTGANTGEVRFMELSGNGVDYVGFKSPADLAGNVIWTLPAAAGASGTVLSTNGSNVLTWSLPSAIGVGDVTGPASSVDNAIARFDQTTGKVIQNSVVKIDDSGNISGAGTISSSGDLTVTGNLTVTGSGSFTAGLSAQSYTNTSDKSLKKDIEPFTGASSIIDKLMPVTFRWKNDDRKKVIGLIAQDMEKVIPEVVSTSNQKGNTIRSYDLGQVLILTLEALKETREELKQTKTELKVMREKVQDLEKRIP